MAGSISINKRKTYAANTRDARGVPRQTGTRPREPPWRAAAPTALRLALSRFCPMMALWTSRAADEWPKTEGRE
jgi:hypothetical protein